MSTAVRSMTARSGPKTLIPRAERMPVASISVRVWMGIHQIFGIPGKRMALSISPMSLSQVIPSRHSLCGLNITLVSIMEIGAGSVGLVLRP